MEPPSIVFNIFKMFKHELAVAFLIKAMADVLQFANPLLLRLLIDHVLDPNGQLWEGVLCALAMFLVSELRSLMVNYYLFIMYRMGTKIQACTEHSVHSA